MKMLDFNSIQAPVWPLKLRDDAQTTVHICAPTVELVEKMYTLSAEMSEIAAKRDGNTIRSLFELIAEVMSANEDGLTFTAEELRDRYKMTLLDTAYFVSGFLDFIKEINEAKN